MVIIGRARHRQSPSRVTSREYTYQHIKYVSAHTLQSYKGRGSQRVEPEVVYEGGSAATTRSRGDAGAGYPVRTARDSRAVGFAFLGPFI